MHSVASRRTRALALFATAATVGGLYLTAPPAEAAVIDTPLSGVSVNFDDNPVGTCNGTGTDSSQTAPFAADGLPHTVSTAATATDTDSVDTGDVTTANVSTSRTTTASQAGGQLSHVTVQDSYNISLSSTRGAAQKCNMSAAIENETEYGFTLLTPSYVTVTVETHNMIGEAISGNSLGGLTDPNVIIAAAVAGGAHGYGVGHVLLPAGTTYIGLDVGAQSVNAPGSASGDATMQVSFDTPGVALAATTGSGSKYVVLDGGQNCAAGTVAATWTAKAGKGKHKHVKKATFFVNGVKAGHAKHPVKKQVTTLHLPSDRAVDVEGTLKLTSGKTVTISRTYQACS